MRNKQFMRDLRLSQNPYNMPRRPIVMPVIVSRSECLWRGVLFLTGLVFMYILTWGHV